MRVTLSKIKGMCVLI